MEILKTEWIETNGLGGYASSTISLLNTRKYHGLFVIAQTPPTGRLVMLSKMDEEIVLDNKIIELGVNQYEEILHPKGFENISLFKNELYPTWVYKINDQITFEKSLIFIHQKNQVLLKYKILKAAKSFQINWVPLFACRDFHSTKLRESNLINESDFSNGILKYKNDINELPILISLDKSKFEKTNYWFNKLTFAEEKERGLDYCEDVFNPGKISKEVKEGDEFIISISTKKSNAKEFHSLFKIEIERRVQLIQNESNKTLQKLILAADQFIVTKNKNLKSIIAGYHWFSDWGRDTMIAINGICITQGKLQIAEKILESFALYESEGMLPNRFPDVQDDEIEYNTVDASLWYFITVFNYLKNGGSEKFILKKILPSLKNIIDKHFSGTRYNIKVDENDGLLFAGNELVQLTWMDAKIGDWVVTPRIGKAVEINALWYNALKIFAHLLTINKQNKDAEIVEIQAEKTKESFNNIFWNHDLNCLYDVVNDDEKDSSIRPNQIFALSLPFKIMDSKDEAISIITTVKNHLLTPYGLRSLSSSHKNYSATYSGNAFQRDSAYHQGTVWSWLIGSYIDAIIYYKEKEGIKEAKNWIQHFISHLNEYGINTISEIFDAEPPFNAKGCIAQAWSVGEVLRVIKEYKLLK